MVGRDCISRLSLQLERRHIALRLEGVAKPILVPSVAPHDEQNVVHVSRRLELLLRALGQALHPVSLHPPAGTNRHTGAERIPHRDTLNLPDQGAVLHAKYRLLKGEIQDLQHGLEINPLEAAFDVLP